MVNAVLYICLGILVAVWLMFIFACLRDCLAIRKESKELDATLKRLKFKEEVRDMAMRMILDETRVLKRSLTSYIDTKLAEMDKQEESREEDKHE